jgi:hypothetical protein
VAPAEVDSLGRHRLLLSMRCGSPTPRSWRGAEKDAISMPPTPSMLLAQPADPDRTDTFVERAFELGDAA